MTVVEVEESEETEPPTTFLVFADLSVDGNRKARRPSSCDSAPSITSPSNIITGESFNHIATVTWGGDRREQGGFRQLVWWCLLPSIKA